MEVAKVAGLSLHRWSWPGAQQRACRSGRRSAAPAAARATSPGTGGVPASGGRRRAGCGAGGARAGRGQ